MHVVARLLNTFTFIYMLCNNYASLSIQKLVIIFVFGKFSEIGAGT